MTLFNAPAEPTRLQSQTAVPAGVFTLIADPHELSFARLAAQLCERGAPEPKPLSQFSSLARRAAGALGVDGPARAADWMAAFARASDMLASLGESAPAPGSIPIELHSHGVFSTARELADLIPLLPALGREQERQPKIRAQNEKGEWVKKAQIARRGLPTQDGVIIAARMHAIAKFAGPAYFDSPFGAGTDRVLIGTGNSDQVETHLSHTGERIQSALREGLQTRVAGKTFALLHECFHLSQSWRSEADRTLAHAVLPDFMRQSPQLARLCEAAWRLELKKDTTEEMANRWMLKTLQESYADLMGAVAFGKKDPQRVSQVAFGVEQWRKNFKSVAKKAKPSLGTRLLGKIVNSKEPDPHHTQHALAALRDLADSKSLSAEDSSERWSEAVKTCAYVGLLRLCVERAHSYQDAVRGASDKEAERLSQEFLFANHVMKTLLDARPNGLDRTFPGSAASGDFIHHAHWEAEEALRDCRLARSPAPSILFKREQPAAPAAPSLGM